MTADFVEEPWYPRVAVTESGPLPSDADDGPPPGHDAWEVHTRWDTLIMATPTGDVAEPQWLAEVLAEAGGAPHERRLELWGDMADFEVPSGPFEVHTTPVGWRLSHPEMAQEIHLLPFDHDGHGRRLAGLDCGALIAPTGGLQWRGRDLILIAPQPGGETAASALKAAVAAEDEAGAHEILTRVGQVLGVFHQSCAQTLATPNAEREWNARNKRLEKLTRSATVWYAPHSPRTEGTITHQNMGLEVVHIDGDEVRLGGCMGGVCNALAPLETAYPAIRDLAAAFASLEAAVGGDVEAERLAEMRKHLFLGWRSTAPVQWSGEDAIDTNRGGIHIWHYEQMLEWRLFHQALGRPEPEQVTRWLSRVSNLQARMFRARTWSAIGLTCLSLPMLIPLWLIWTESFHTFGTAHGAAMLIAAVFGWQARRWYRRTAPEPWA